MGAAGHGEDGAGGGVGEDGDDAFGAVEGVGLIDDGFDAVLEVHVDGEEDIRAVFGGDGFATEEGEFDTAAIFFDEAFARGATEDVFAELFDAPDATGVFFGGPEGEGEAILGGAAAFGAWADVDADDVAAFEVGFEVFGGFGGDVGFDDGDGTGILEGGEDLAGLHLEGLREGGGDVLLVGGEEFLGAHSGSEFLRLHVQDFGEVGADEGGLDEVVVVGVEFPGFLVENEVFAGAIADGAALGGEEADVLEAFGGEVGKVVVLTDLELKKLIGDAGEAQKQHAGHDHDAGADGAVSAEMSLVGEGLHQRVVLAFTRVWATVGLSERVVATASEVSILEREMMEAGSMGLRKVPPAVSRSWTLSRLRLVSMRFSRA